MDERLPGAPSGRRLSAMALAWRWALLVMALMSAVLNVLAMSNWRPALDPAVAGHHGIFTYWSQERGWLRIEGLQPGSPVEQAGARVGDLVRFDHPSDANFIRAMGVNESIGLTWRSAAGERRLAIQPMSKPGFSAPEALASWVMGWINRWLALGIAVLLALRASDQPGLRALAVCMVVVSTWGDYFLPGGRLHDAVLLWLLPLRFSILTIGLLYFALRFAAAEHMLWPRPAVRGGLLALALLSVVYVLDDALATHGLVAGSALQQAIGQVAWTVLDPYVIGAVLSLAALVGSWRRSLGLQRARVGWVVMALGLLLVSQLLFNLSYLLDAPVPHRFLWLDAVTCASLALLAYAVVRHRVFDIGFALNRVLVFSIASAIVVAARVVLDWATRQLMHGAVADTPVAVDAAITLVLVLLFLPLQRVVGERVTRLFFRQWEASAEQLRAFVERAPHVTDAGELRRKLLSAIDAFGSGTGSAMFVQDGSGYRCVESTARGAPERIDENDDTVVELRRVQGAVPLGDSRGTTPLAARFALALPISARGRLGAFVLVGHKPQQELYRPDELTLLARSVRSVGLDLEALRVEELERDRARIRDEAERLRFALASWQGAAAPRSGQDR